MNSRLKYVDIYKGIGILLMVAGHIGFFVAVCPEFDKWIHTFHMPMFFFITGWLYKKSPIKEVISKKAKTLLLPYIVFATICLFIYSLIHGFNVNQIITVLLFNSVGIPYAGALWFLTALFCADVIYVTIDHLDNICVKTIIIVLLSIFGLLYRKWIPIPLPWSMGASLVSLLLIHIGRLAREYKESKILNAGGVLLIFLSITSLLLNYLAGDVNMRSEVYENVLMFYPSAILTSITILSISNKISLLNVKCKILSLIGQKSINYVCLNQLVILALSYIIGHIIDIQNIVISTIIYILTITIIFIYGEIFDTKQ